MSTQTTHDKLLSQAETPLQTMILLSQLKILRDLDRKRFGFSTPMLLFAMVAVFVIWACVARAVAIALSSSIPALAGY